MRVRLPTPVYQHAVLVLLVPLLLPRPCPGGATIELHTAALTLDDQGRVRSLTSADGSEHAVPGPPAFFVEIDDVTHFPTAVTGTPDGLTITFEGGATAAFRVTPRRGFVLFELQKLTSARAIERFRLPRRPIPFRPR